MLGMIAKKRTSDNRVFGTTCPQTPRLPRKHPPANHASPLKLFSRFRPTAELGLDS
jgi:hypothetical protein